MNNINLYTKDWRYVSNAYLKKVGNRCEDCGVKKTRDKIVAVDHIDGNKKNNDESNLKARCPKCHYKKGVEAGEIPVYISNAIRWNKWRHKKK